MSFHPNRKVMRGILSKAASIKAQKNNGSVEQAHFDAGWRIYLNADGILVGAFPEGQGAGPIQFSKELSPALEE